MKRPRPQDARRDLRKLWSSVAIYSCADGTLRIEPTWRKTFNRPGMLTRMHSAYLMEALTAMPKRQIKWADRLPDTARTASDWGEASHACTRGELAPTVHLAAWHAAVDG